MARLVLPRRCWVFIASMFLLAATTAARGQTVISVGNSSDLANAIQTIDSNPNTSYTLSLTGNVTMSQQVQAITTNATINVAGNGYTIDGGNAYRPFFIESGNVTLQNLTVANSLAQGGSGGGGGLGAGAAVFVDTSGHLTIQNVNFTNNAAVGGAGGAGYSAGGGGLGGNGGAGVTDYSGGGGGGLHGNGGSVTAGGDSGSGGGGGELGNGGAGQQIPITQGGGGGGGTTANGAPGSGNTGGAGGGAQGGAGGSASFLFGNPGSSGSAGGGGGGSGFNSSGGSGGLFGGGGGGNVGGNGGRFGGGGGGGSYGTGNGTAGSGGFGGGGGNSNGSNPASGGTGGAGGFGGGGGGGYTPGSGGFGGGAGSTSGGGGGAAFGGAVFVANGATITFADAAGFSANSVVAGTGASGAGNGSADGNDIYLMRGVSTTFDISSGQTLTFAPAIGNNDGTSNAGVTIDKTGAGTLVLTGNSALSGAATVDAGTLAVNGTLGGSMTVNSGGTLMGTGTVGATTVNSGGTIYPGTVGAPLTINGNFTQAAGSTYSAEVNPTGSDKLIVNGSAHITSGATFNVVLDPGTYTAGTHYTILTASSGVTGTYSTTILPSFGSGMFFSLDYEPGEIELILNAAPGTHFSASATNFNQLAVATTLDHSSIGAAGDYGTVIAQLQTLSTGQLPGALNQLAGDIYPSIGAIELQTTTTWMQLLSNRIAGQLSPASLDSPAAADTAASPEYDADVQLVSYQDTSGQVQTTPRVVFRQRRVPVWSGWAQGYGLGGNVSGNSNAGGLNYGLGGMLLGADRWLDGNTLLGFFGGYAGTSLGDQLVGSSARLNGYQLGTYQLFRRDRCYLSNFDAFSADNYSVTRSIDFGTIARTASGSSTGNQWAHYTEAGFTLGGGRMRLQPFTGFQYIALDQGGYNESGAGSLDQSIGRTGLNSFRGSFGARLYHELTCRGIRFIPSATARYQHEWGDGTQLISSSFAGAPTLAFSTAGNYLGRDFGLFSLGTSALLSDRSSLYASLNSQVSPSYAAIMGSGGFQHCW
ncbi:MAG TPA: autotransporter domain-containing protein [Pirellulales bacterium]|nr:autotransporter domain-containing protein [Pirellulales bacterium]